MAPDNGVKVFFENLNRALEMIGRPQPEQNMMKARLVAAGFVDVKVLRFKQPFGAWPKDKRIKTIGSMMMVNAETAFQVSDLRESFPAFSALVAFGDLCASQNAV
jgi:hypothetical protein